MVRHLSFISLIGILGGVFLFSNPASAADLRVPTGDAGNVTVFEDETVSSLYSAGAIVTIDGTVENGVHVAGGTVIVNGSVGHSVYAAGGTVILRGEIGGSAHVGGGSVVIESPITNDLFIGGGNVSIAPSASVGGDVIVAGGNVLIEGQISGDVKLAAGAVTINSEITGSVNGVVEDLILDERAIIGTDLRYTSVEEAEFRPGATVLGETHYTFKSHSSNRFGFLKVSLAFFFIEVFALVVLGLVLVYPFKKYMLPAMSQAIKNPGPSIGYGIATGILMPIVIILLSITVIGLGVAGLVGLLYALLLLVAVPTASILLGSWFLKTVTKHKDYKFRWQEVVLGTVLLSLIGIVPIIGWLAYLAMVALTFGAYVLALSEMHKKKKRKK